MEKQRYIEGLAMGSVSFIIWGLLPLYWRWLNVFSPYQLFAQRVIWSFAFVVLLLVYKRKGSSFFKAVGSKRQWFNVIAPSVFISINWLCYIWAVNNGYVIETSLGYYINPLVLTFFGAVFYKERLTRLQKIGITFAAVGVILQTLLYGALPYIALTLAFCFAMYGLLKKKSDLDSLTGLAFETCVIGVPSLVYILYSEMAGAGITGNLPWYFWVLVSTSGVITAVPLLLYAEGTKRLPLSIVGFLQYIAPTIALGLGIFVFKESFDGYRMLAFVCIWIGLGFFMYSQYLLLRDSV